MTNKKKSKAKVTWRTTVSAYEEGKETELSMKYGLQDRDTLKAEGVFGMIIKEYSNTIDTLADMCWGNELDCKQVDNLQNDHNKRIKPWTIVTK